MGRSWVSRLVLFTGYFVISFWASSCIGIGVHRSTDMHWCREGRNDYSISKYIGVEALSISRAFVILAFRNQKGYMTNTTN